MAGIHLHAQLLAAGAFDAHRILGLQPGDRICLPRQLRLQSIRPNLLHHFGFGYTASNPIRQRDSRHGNEIYKLPGVAGGFPGFPVFNVNNTYGSLALGNSDQQPNDPSQNRNYSFVDNVTWIKGRHQLKFGVDIRFLQYDNFAGTVNGGLSGSFVFNPLSTADLSLAEFLSAGERLGEPPARSGLFRAKADSGAASGVCATSITHGTWKTFSR